MDKQKRNDNAMNHLRIQLTIMKVALLFIPLYLYLLSPTCGIFGQYLWRISSLQTIALVAVIPGILFSFFGVFDNSNAATGISGAFLMGIMMLNTMAFPFLTIFDFTLLLFFLEFSTTLNSFSGVMKTIRIGAGENVSYNYKVTINAYVIRLVTIMLVTVSVSCAAAFLALNVVTQIGSSGIIVLSILALILVFAVIVARYRIR